MFNLKTLLYYFPIIVIGIAGLVFFAYSFNSSALERQSGSFTETEAGFDEEPDETSLLEAMTADDTSDYRVGRGQYTLSELANWKRPAGVKRVGLQVGHLDNQNVPEELSGLTRNGAGAVWGPYNERDTVEVITELTAERLRAEGIAVDVLPAVIPPGYVADAFIAIHADGNNNETVRGFKIAPPRRDYAGTSAALTDLLYESYAQATGLPTDPSISRRMTAYYSFNWPRYVHAVHPYTPSAIVEVGFLTNQADRAMMLNQPERAAAGIANGVLSFLSAEVEPEPLPVAFAAPTLPVTGTLSCAPVRAERRNRPAPDCQASLVTEQGDNFVLMSEQPIATSSFPYTATIEGQFQPIQTLDNYFWFPFEVQGIIVVDEIKL